MHRRRTEHTCEGTRAGRAGVGHGERTGRRVRCSSTRAPRLTLTAWRVDGASGRTWQCLPRYSKLHQEERQRTCIWPPWPRWPGVARRAPRGRGRCLGARARSRVAEDCTRTSRGRARAKMVLSRRERPVSRFGQKKEKSTTCEPSTLRRSAWSRPPRGRRSACTSLPRRARARHWKWAG